MIVFTFMQEDSRTEENYLVTNIFKSKEELLDKWLVDFLGYWLVDMDEYGEPIYDEDDDPVYVSPEKMKEILTGKWDGVRFEANDGEVYYTFSVVNTEE